GASLLPRADCGRLPSVRRCRMAGPVLCHEGAAGLFLPPAAHNRRQPCRGRAGQAFVLRFCIISPRRGTPAAQRSRAVRVQPLDPDRPFARASRRLAVAPVYEASCRIVRDSVGRRARRWRAVLRPRGDTLSRAARRRRFLQLLVLLLRPGGVHGPARLNAIPPAAVWLALVAPSLFIVHKYSGAGGAAAYAAVAAVALAAAPRLPVPRSPRVRLTVAIGTIAVVM